MTLSRKECRYSRTVAYCLVLVSALTLCNAAVQTVSSQTFDTSTTTETSTDPGHIENFTETTHFTATETSTEITHFTVAYATSSLYLTIFSVQYTTAISLFTIVNVQFTTITSFITRIELPTPAEAPSPPVPSTPSENSLRNEQPSSSTPPRLPPIVADALFGHIPLSLMSQLIACSAILLALILIRTQRK